jgi:hypothetical protein
LGNYSELSKPSGKITEQEQLKNVIEIIGPVLVRKEFLSVSYPSRIEI